LKALNGEALNFDGEIEAISAALVEARARLEQARRDEAVEEDKRQAREVRKQLVELLKTAEQADQGLAILVEALGYLAVCSSLMQTIWGRRFDPVPPLSRTTFGNLTAGWATAIDRNIRLRLGEPEQAATPAKDHEHNEDWRQWYERQRKRDHMQPVRKDDDDFDENDLQDIDDAIDTTNDDPNNARSTAARHCSDLADLIVEAQPRLDRSDAIRWLLNNRRGHALLLRTLKRRLQKRTKQMTSYNRAEEWTAIVKQHGPIKFAKFLVDEPEQATAITEHEFVKACGKNFVKLYAAQDADGLVMRTAIDLIKNAQFTKRTVSYPDIRQPTPASLTPRVSGGRAAQDVNNPVDAYSQIEQLAKEQNRTFVEVYTDPKFRDLAELERRQARDKMIAGLPLMPT
jgi:hypothetical protein